MGCGRDRDMSDVVMIWGLVECIHELQLPRVVDEVTKCGCISGSDIAPDTECLPNSLQHFSPIHSSV